MEFFFGLGTRTTSNRKSKNCVLYFFAKATVGLRFTIAGGLNSVGERAGAAKEERGERTEGARTLTTHSLSLVSDLLKESLGK